MDERCSLKGLSALAMTLCHHFVTKSTSDPVPQNLSKIRWVQLFEAALLYTHGQHINCSNTLFVYV
jgi:hypothetical protein